MKALSIKQPFATFIVLGLKDREHRSWNTNFRGEFLVHASIIPDLKFMKEYGLCKEAFVYGAIIGEATIYGVGKYGDNNYAFFIENPIKFKKPIKAKGSLNFWDYKNV